MSNSIKLSPRFGLNPTIPVCFWCGNERNEIAILGHIGDGRKHEDFEAPMKMVLDFEPCEKCKKNMALGFTIMEATDRPNSRNSVEIQKGIYPTGRFIVITTDAAHRFFGDIVSNTNKAFVDTELFIQLISGGV